MLVTQDPIPSSLNLAQRRATRTLPVIQPRPDLSPAPAGGGSVVMPDPSLPPERDGLAPLEFVFAFAASGRCTAGAVNRHLPRATPKLRPHWRQHRNRSNCKMASVVQQALGKLVLISQRQNSSG